jgi:hypothetical protein
MENKLIKSMDEFNSFKFEHEEIIKADEWFKYHEKEYDDNIIFIIIAEHWIESKKINIHYDMKFWGSKKFNKWLSKYNYGWEWYESCYGYVYKKEDKKKKYEDKENEKKESYEIEIYNALMG